MLRSYRGQPRGVEEARRMIKEVLSNIGKGALVDFGEKISEVKVKTQCPLK